MAALAINVNLVLLHGFWSSPATWNRLVSCVRADHDLRNVNVRAFGYESPKLRWPFSTTRIPEYDDVAQTLPSRLTAETPDGDLAVVTHSQGGLILQRFLAWMVTEGRASELARIRLIVMLACPNEGSDYLRSIRAAAGLGRHPQANELRTLNEDVIQARRIVLDRIVNAAAVEDHECPIPIHVYAGSSDNIVRRASAQSVFPNVGSLPGNHFSILDAGAPGNITFPVLKRHLIDTLQATSQTKKPIGPRTEEQRRAQFNVTISDSSRIQIGDNNEQYNTNGD